jgi:CDP-paratose 2-epimerase
VTVAVVTGSSGLVGSEAVRFLHDKGLDVVGIDNDLRSHFFGLDASTRWNAERLGRELPHFTHVEVDVRDEGTISALFRRYSRDIELVVHCAAQPSHDWAAREPLTDFGVNATGTLHLLEATRIYAPEAAFALLSTNKVYGDAPNSLPLVELETRWEVDSGHPYAEHGIDETMTVDQSKHSLFGASKLAADVLTQEYGRYFGLRTVAFRCGCVTGPAHSGAELHGFLAYLVQCAVTGTPYTVHGYKGKQVRDNLDARDLVRAIWLYALDPRPAAVYNMGGGRARSCSVLEAIRLVEELSARGVTFTIDDLARQGDHIWWISDLSRFEHDYPAWLSVHSLRSAVEDMIASMSERLAAQR